MTKEEMTNLKILMEKYYEHCWGNFCGFKTENDDFSFLEYGNFCDRANKVIIDLNSLTKTNTAKIDS